MTDEIVNATFDVVLENEARVNITVNGQNGDLPQPVPVDATDAEIKEWVTEAVRTGSVPGMEADPTADFTDFVVDRFAPTAERPFSLVQTRPKTPFGLVS